MKKNHLAKILGTLMVALLIGTIGAAMVTADDTINTETPEKTFGMYPPKMSPPPFFKELAEDQQTELITLIETLKDDGATKEDIRSAVKEKLSEWGIDIEKPELTDEERDERLDKKIEKTEQHLEILNRVKELRAEGYEYEDIKDIIQNEYDIDPPEMHPPKHRHRRQRQFD